MLPVREVRTVLCGLALVALVGCQCGPGPVPPPAPDAGAPTRLRLSPSTLRFTALNRTEPFKVFGLVAGEPERDLTARAGFSSRKPAIATVAPDGRVTSAAAGMTAVDVTVDGLTAALWVEVDLDVRAPAWVEFFNAPAVTGLRKPGVWGQTEPFAKIAIGGGSAAVATTADRRGLFALELPLLSNTVNALSVTLTDRQGNSSPAYPLVIEQRDSLARIGQLSLVGGNMQTGLVGQQPLAPLVVKATGPGGAALGGRRVTFRALNGGGGFPSAERLEVLTDPDGKARAVPTLGREAGRGSQFFMAQLEGDWGQPVFFTLNTAVESSQPASVSGHIMTQDTVAIPGATLFLKDSRGVVLQRTTSDGRGDFTLAGVPPGAGYSLFVDGRSVTLPGRYPDLIFDVNVVAGIDNPLSAPVVLPRLPAGVALPLDANGVATATTELRVMVNPRLPPMVLTVPQGTRVTWPPGIPAADQVLRLVAVPTFGVPMPFPDGLSSSNVIAIQPANTLFDPPLPIRMPNVDGIAPGAVVKMFSFDHVAKDYRTIGTGTVDAQAQYVVSDPGSGIRKGAWHIVPPAVPCVTIAFGIAGKGPGPAAPDPDCPPNPLECTCTAPGLASTACSPGERIWVPNVACATEIEVVMTCKGKFGDEGTTVKIRNPKNNNFFGTKKDVTFEAYTCPKGREAEIEWSTEEKVAAAPATGAGPVFITRFTKGSQPPSGGPNQGTLIKAKLGKTQDWVTVMVSDKCVSDGILMVCGKEVEPEDKDGKLFKITGDAETPVRIGFEGKVLGLKYAGDVRLNTSNATISSLGGGWAEVKTDVVTVPITRAPFEVNTRDGRISMSSTGVGIFTELKLVAAAFGAEFNISDPKVIEGGASVRAKLKLGNAFELNGVDAYPYEQVEFVEGAIPKFSATFKLSFDVKGAPLRLKELSVKFNFPDEIEVEGQIYLGYGKYATSGIVVGAGINFTKGTWAVKVGVKDANLPLPGPAAWLAMQDLAFKITKKMDDPGLKEAEIEGKITTNSLRTDILKDILEFNAKGVADFWDSFKLGGNIRALKGHVELANAMFVSGGENLISLVWDISLAYGGNGLFISSRGAFGRDATVSGSADASLRWLGKTVTGRGFDLKGAWSGDPFLDFTGRIGELDLPGLGKFASQSLGVRIDTHSPFIKVRFCADFQEVESKPWAGAPLDFTVPPGAPAAMLRVQRTPSTAPAGFTLQLPSGTMVNPPGAPGAAYIENVYDGTSQYLLDAPDGGTYRVTTVVDPQSVRTISLMLPNATPTLSLGPLRQTGPMVQIDWVAKDPDDPARISLYYDVDGEHFDGALIKADLAETDGAGTFSWDTSTVPSGEYSVFAIVDDQHDHPARVYAPNRILVVDPLAPAAATALRAFAKPGGARLEWATVPGAVFYTVMLERAGSPPRELRAGNNAWLQLEGLDNGATYRATVAATNADGRVGAPSDRVELAPRSPGFNLPLFTSLPVGSAKVGRPYRSVSVVNDADPQDLATFTLEAGPPGMVVSSAGLVTWSPAAGQEGTHRVTVRARDRAGLTQDQQFSVQVAASITANVAPELLSAAPTLVTPGQPFTHQVLAVDADEDVLTYALEAGPTGMTINPASGAVGWSPQLADFAQGPVAAVIAVKDAAGAFARQQWRLKVDDSDGDGLHDGFEIAAGLDPLKADSNLNGTLDGDEDGDGDGLKNSAEQAAGSSPKLADTDGDGLTDGDEVTRGTRPVERDTDGDGLEDASEVMRRTDPLKPDSDGDGARDGDEVRLGTDPLAVRLDLDNDGLSDDLERFYGTSPSLADTDGDTLADAAEVTGGTSPVLADTDRDGVNDALDPRPLDRRDTDGDGLSDDREFLLKTNPQSDDTDGDGRSDLVEVLSGLNPLSAADNPSPPTAPVAQSGRSKPTRAVPDGLSDVGIINLGVDADLDGIPDAVEARYSLDPGNAADALLDPDGDGLSNVAEYLAGTNPNKADTDGDGASDSAELRVGTDPLDPNSHNLDLMLASIEIVPSLGRITLNTVEGPQPYPLRVLGTMSDGSKVDLTASARGTTYVSSKPFRLAVNAEGVVVPIGSSPPLPPAERVIITAKNGTKSAMAAIDVDIFIPKPVTTLALGPGLRRMSTQAGRIYVASADGLWLVDTARPGSPAVLTMVPVPGGGARDVASSSGFVYLATATGLMFLDVGQVSGATQVGFVPVAGGVGAVALDGNHLYALAGNRLLVVKANAPSATSLVDLNADGVDDRIVATLSLGTGVAGRLSVSQGLAAIDFARTLVMVDVSNPLAPVRQGSAPLGTGSMYGPLSLQLEPRTVYTANSSALLAFDVSAPAMPAQVSEVMSVFPSAVTARGPYAFVADWRPGSPIFIFRKSNIGFVAGQYAEASTATDPALDLAVEQQFIYSITSSQLRVGQFLAFTDAGLRPPVVLIAAPSGGSFALENRPLAVQVSAVDDVGVASVDMLVNGVPAGQQGLGSGPSYSFTVQVPALAQGPLVLQARAVDFAGNLGLSPPLTVQLAVDRPPSVTVVEPLTMSIVRGRVRVGASAVDDDAVREVEFFADGSSIGKTTAAPYEVMWTTDLLPKVTYRLTAVATDTAGKKTTSAAVLVTVENNPPTVALTAPGPGAVVRGQVPISATATDDAPGVVVDFLADSTLLGTAPAAPYSATWDSCSAADGAHQLIARARDRGANVAQATVAVALDNAATAPVLSANPGPARVTLAWTTCGIASGFNLYWSTSAGVTTSSTRISNVSRPFSHTGLPLGTRHYYRVAALRGTQEGPLSNEVSAVPGAPGICSREGFCQEFPKYPKGSSFVALWGTSATDTWASDGAAQLLHWDGTQWSSQLTGLTLDPEIRGLWGSATDDLWGVGAKGSVLRWNGSTWGSVASGTSEHLNAVWGSAANDVWAVGAAGTIRHWNGAAWTTVPSGTGLELLSVWGSTAGDVWIGGASATLLRWNGSAWSTVAAPAGIIEGISSLWGSGPNDIWGTGDYTGLLHFGGGGWTRVTAPSGSTYARLWGSGPNNVWAASPNGTVLRWDGSAWSRVISPLLRAAGAIWGYGPADVWVAGQYGKVLRWNGAGWSVSLGLPWREYGSIGRMWGSGASDVWAVGEAGMFHHWDGTQWSQVPSGTTVQLNDVWGSSATDVWSVGTNTTMHWAGTGWTSVPITAPAYLRAVGGSGGAVWAAGSDSESSSQVAQVHRWGGSAWSVAYATPPSFSGFITALWASSSTDAWAVGQEYYFNTGVVLHWNGTQWSPAGPGGNVPRLDTVWGSSANDVWIAGNSGVTQPSLLHWNGAAWSSVANPLGSNNGVGAITGTSPTDAWALSRAILRWDGTAWTASGYLRTGRTMTTAGATTWIGGSNNTLLKWNGTKWVTSQTSEVQSTAALNAVAFLSATDGWAVGTTILRWDGFSWSEVLDPVSPVPWKEFRGVWASGPMDAWAVGDGGTMLHWDGTTWSRVASGVTADLVGIWGSGTNDVWAVSTQGHTLHWNGSAWQSVSNPSLMNGQLKTVWGTGPSDVWAAAGGAGIHWDGTAWTSFLFPDPFQTNVVALWGSGPNAVWAVGVAGGVTSPVATTAHFWNGTVWSVVPCPGTGLRAIWGRTASDIWAAGRLGTLVHWDGAAWTARSAGVPTESLWWEGIQGLGTGELRLVGNTSTNTGGLILNYQP